MEKEMFIEIMTHILTLENILMVNYKISDKALVEALKLNKEHIIDQLNKIKDEEEIRNDNSKPR